MPAAAVRTQSGVGGNDLAVGGKITAGQAGAGDLALPHEVLD